MKRFSWLSYIIFGLMLIGIVGTLIKDSMSIILPVVIIGGIFLLVKYPPSFLTRNKANTTYKKSANYYKAKQSKGKATTKRSKPIPFKVIEGGKDDNDTPRYH